MPGPVPRQTPIPSTPGLRPLYFLLAGCLLLPMGLTAVTSPVEPDTLPDPTGLWLTEDENAVIAIEWCADTLCGTIHWMEAEAPGTDVENPDESLRDRPLCGLEILSGFTPNPDREGEWEDGEVYAADEGSTYSGRIRMEDPDRLELRGYRGITLFGRSQSWVRVDEEDFPRCTPPDSGSVGVVLVGLVLGDLVEEGVGEAGADHLVEPLGFVAHLEEADHLVVDGGIPSPQGVHETPDLVVGLVESLLECPVDRTPTPLFTGVGARSRTGGSLPRSGCLPLR